LNNHLGIGCLSVKTASKRKVGVFLSVPAKFERWSGRHDYGPAIRQEVIDRWHACGFKVFTVNGGGEAKFLQPELRDVEIIEVDDEPRVRIGTIAKIARSKKLDVAIFSNADCLPIGQAIMRMIIDKIGSNTVCMGERMNINAASLVPTGLLCTGFDTFFVGAEALKNVPDETHWRIGDPIWDYWFPWHQRKMGAEIYNAGVPVVMHLDHPQAWNFKMWRPKLKAFFDEIPIDSDLFPRSFNRRFGRTEIDRAVFLKRLSVSMALYTSLLEFPNLLTVPATASFWNLQMKMLNTNAKQSLFRRLAMKASAFFEVRKGSGR
jgi:hypothetical protein